MENMENLFQWTGHPFADNGLAAMLAHCEKVIPQGLDETDVATMSELLTTVYLSRGWLKAMQNIFPNGALSNPAFAKDRSQPWGNVLSFLTQNLKPAQKNGSCICCGSRDAVRMTAEQKKQKIPNDMVFNKVYVPLIGGIPNFFPGGVVGADFCANCVFLIQCAPLSFYTSNSDEKRFLLVHSNSQRVMKRWANEALADVDGQIATNQLTGPFNDGYKNAINAFFHIADLVLADLDLAEEDKYTQISLYHFDNYNQPKPTPLKIYSMPASIFRFLLAVKNSGFRSNWDYIVARNYFFIKNGTPIPRELKEEQAEERKNTRNLVFENLLGNKPITSRFYSKRQRLVYAPWNLLSLYLKEIRSMPNERIETLKRVADELAEVIKNSPKSNKKSRLNDIENAKTYASFRNVLLKCAKERLRTSEVFPSTPLFSFDEYVEQLFPDGAASWRETQDLLLFRLYETLHEWLKTAGVPETDIDHSGDEEQAA